MNRQRKTKSEELKAEGRKSKAKSYELRPGRGFTLLFASLIVSLLLAVGLAILEITLQQYLLSSAGRESQFAFYNADTGIECAIYYDKNSIKNKYFAESDLSLNDPNSYQTGDQIVCGNQIGIIGVSADSGAASTTFSVVLDPNQCLGPNPGESFSILLTKTMDLDGNFQTQIQSRGYNTCDLNSKQRVERGLQVDY